MRVVLVWWWASLTVATCAAAAEQCAFVAARWVGGPTSHAAVIDDVAAVDTRSAVTLVALGDLRMPLALGQVDLGQSVVDLAAVDGGLVAATADGTLWFVDPADRRRPVARPTFRRSCR